MRRAPKQFTPKAARRLAANAFQEIMTARLEDQWKILSARNAKKGSYRQRLFTDIMRQLPQSQKVYRHDRCCPRGEQTWKPAALKCSAFWRRHPVAPCVTLTRGPLVSCTFFITDITSGSRLACAFFASSRYIVH